MERSIASAKITLIVHDADPSFPGADHTRARPKVHCTNGVKMPRPGREGWAGGPRSAMDHRSESGARRGGSASAGGIAMAVLVTGGAGYIGSHMVWELLDAGEDVVVLDRLSTGFDWAVPPEAKLVVGDIGDDRLVRSIIRRSRDRRDHPFRRLDRGAGIGRRSARLLREQHRQDARAARGGGREARCRTSSSPRPPRSMAAPA